MKTLNYTTALIALMASFFSQAKYVENFYFGMGINTAKYEVDNSNHRLKGNLNAIHFMTGVAINPYFALEARYGLGFFNDKYTVDNQTVEAKLTSAYGFYAKGSLGMFDLITPYGLIGYTRSAMSSDSNISGSYNSRKSDLSYGAGLAFNFFPILVNLEYIKYLETNEYQLSGVNVNFSTTF